MGGNPTKFKRPGQESSPCLAVLNRDSSKLKLVSLNGETSRSIKISDLWSLGIVTIDGQVHAVNKKNILKINSDGTVTVLVKLDRGLNVFAQVVSFQSSLYVIEPNGRSMIRFNPADKTVADDLSVCQLAKGFCCCAAEDFIYAMGGLGTRTSAKKYDPLTNTWTDIKPMKYERWEPSAAAALNKRIYVLGGTSPPEFYDPQTSTWNGISNMNVNREDFNACVINNQLYAVGGDAFGEQQSVEVYDGSRWNIVVKFKFETKYSRPFACVWPHDLEKSDLHVRNNSPALSEKLSKDVEEEVVETQTGRNPKESKLIGREGGSLKLSDVEIKIPKRSLPEDKKVSFSTHVVTDQEDELADVAPRLQTNSPVEFSIPVSVKMETCISAASPGESIPLIVQQRENPNEEWEEIDQISVGERNEIDFKMNRGRETRIAINFRNMTKELRKRFGKWKKGVADRFRIRVHAREDFYINRKTFLLAATFAKDRNTQNLIKEDLLSKDFVPFSLHLHPFIAQLGTKITTKMVCESPQESEIKDEVYPTPSFSVDNDFLIDGWRCFHFNFEQEPSVDCKRINLMFQCSLNDELNHKIPLAIDWPLQGKQARRDDYTIEESLRKKRTIKHDSQISKSETGSAKTVPDGAVGGKEKNDILARILMKGEEVLVLCYSQQYDEITRMTAHLTEDKLFKQVNTLPIPVCNHTGTSNRLQLEVYPPNEGNVTIHPSRYDVDIERIRRGPVASFTFLCKSNKTDVDAMIELRFTTDNDIKSKHPFSFTRHQHEKSETHGNQRPMIFNGPVGQVFGGDGNITAEDYNVAGSQEIDRSVTAGHLYEGETHVNATGGSTTISRNETKHNITMEDFGSPLFPLSLPLAQPHP